MDKNTAYILEHEYGIETVSDFIDMDDNKRSIALKGKDVDKIAAACNRYPIVNMQCQVSEGEEGEVAIIVTLSKDDELEDDAVICPYYSDARK